MFHFGVNSMGHTLCFYSWGWGAFCVTSYVMENYFCTKLFLKLIYANFFGCIASVVFGFRVPSPDLKVGENFKPITSWTSATLTAGGVCVCVWRRRVRALKREGVFETGALFLLCVVWSHYKPVVEKLALICSKNQLFCHV